MAGFVKDYLYPFLLHLETLTLVCSIILLVMSAILIAIIYYNRQEIHENKCTNTSNMKVGFFHPYCNAGGGGERVLWVAVEALQRRYPEAEFYIYTGDIDVTADEILKKVKNTMNIEIQKNIKFIYLTKRRYIEASKYPCFTLLGQAIGSMLLGFEALQLLNPDIMIDTTGLTFAMIVFKYIGDCRTGSYIHYPTITKQMTRRVSNRETLYNNSGRIARSPFLTYGKLLYYKLFSLMYSYAGKFSDITLVNSTFTLEHLTVLWNTPLHLVYPPCDVKYFRGIKRRTERPKIIKILSLAQFRPEKNHALQLQSLYELREIVEDEVFEKISLVLIGSSRNAADEAFIKDLKDLSKHLSLDDNVQFKVNVSFEDLRKELEDAFIGMHTMEDEHFGISVVEQMAAGLLVVAHRSGGPLLDIIETSVNSRLGFLATSSHDYAHCIKYMLSADEAELNLIRDRARASVDRFSTKKFIHEFIRTMGPLFRV